jgi:hypothetical protein
VTIRLEGERPAGFYRLAGALMERAVRSNFERDLATLKRLMEQGGS